MTHDRLIEQLTEGLKPVRRRHPSLDFAVVAAICAIELALFFAMGAARPDMMKMMHQPSVCWRLGSLGLIALTSFCFAILSFNPAYSPKRGIGWLALIVVICVAVGVLINAGPEAQLSILRRLYWQGGLQCTTKVVLLSIPPIIGLALLMRRGAPTDIKRTALLAGLAAASWGAFVFVFACPSDDPLYIAVWYSAGCGIITALSRLVLPLLARW